LKCLHNQYKAQRYDAFQNTRYSLRKYLISGLVKYWLNIVFLLLILLYAKFLVPLHQVWR
jgi:hypothetical protein